MSNFEKTMQISLTLIDDEVIQPHNANFVFEGQKKYNEFLGVRQRVVDSFCTGDWFIKTQNHVRQLYNDPDISVLALILSFDETTLTGGTGGSARSTTPIYLSLGNINLTDGKLPTKAIQCLGFFPEILVMECKKFYVGF